MRVLVIGANGTTARSLVEVLAAAGHHVKGMIRDESQTERIQALGGEPVLGDLEGEMAGAFADVDAVVFCAGSGPSTGADATLRVDLHGAVRCVDSCLEAGVSRFVMLSSIAADDPLRGPEKIRHYLAAKHAADRILLASGLDATVVRPGGLTDEDATGQVEVGVPRLSERGSIARADVALVLAGCLERPETIGVSFEVIAGSTPIEDALSGLA